MRNKIKSLVIQLLENIHEHRRVVIALSCLVVFITTYTLILPAFTLEKDEAAEQGGIDIPVAAEVQSDVQDAAVPTANAADSAADAKDNEKSEAVAPLVFDGTNYSVVVADKNNALSGSTRVEVKEIAETDKAQAKKYEELYKTALDAVNAESGDAEATELSFAKFYDISLVDGTKSVEPEKAVDVTISFEKALQKELNVANPENVLVVRLAKNEGAEAVSAEVLDSKDVDITVENEKVTEATFEADGTSVYGITEIADSEEAQKADGEETVSTDAEEDNANAAESEEIKEEATQTTDTQIVSLRKMPKAKAVTNDTVEELEHHKTLTPNVAANGKWDGTYTLSLDIVGKQISEETTKPSKADIILVLDMSSSMIDNSVGGKTRFEIEREAVKSFGSSLLASNADEPDTIRMSVMTFGNMGNAPVISSETSAAAFERAVANLEPPHSGVGGLTSGGQATNWEDALTKANDISTREDAKKIVIFVSDGQPTLRNTPDNPHAMESFMYRQIGAYGPGTDTPSGWWSDPDILESVVQKCYNNAKDEAKAIVDSKKDFYAITVFEDVSRMKKLVAYAYSGNDSGSYPDGHYKTANNASELASVFGGLIEVANSATQYKEVKITDTLTVATKSSLQVDGHAYDFKYYKTNKAETPAEPSNAPKTLSKKVKSANSANLEEWVDAPKASYNNGQVEWDLSSVGALEDGVTYTVAFTVWPNQDAYDAIMKLNNSEDPESTLAEIAEQYPDVAKNLTKDPESGKYVIYSNGKAEVSYDKVTTVNGQQQQPESKSLEYPRPTMKTLEYTMDVAKIWKDSLYAANRPDSITLNVIEDGKEEPYTQVTLNEDNKWKATIPISPGIISDQIIKDERLNEGHVYTVVEANSDFHYDLESEEMTPMLENGVLHLLGDKDSNSSLSGINHMRGSMTITKKVIDEKGKDISSDTDVADKDFSFKVSLFQPVNSDGFEEITGKTKDDEDAVWYKLLDDKGQEIGDAQVINSGDTFKLKPGHSLRLLNLPRGLKYKVEEVTGSNPTGFEFDSEEYDSVSETNDNTVELTPDKDGYCIAQPNTWQYVTVTNKKVEEPVGSIKITKNVTIDGSPTTTDAADGDYYFTITDKDGNPATGKVGDTNITDGTVKITVTHGKASEVTVTDVPAGTYTIGEADTNNGTELKKIDNVDVSATSSKNITIEKDKTATISFTNDKSSAAIEDYTSQKVIKKWLDKDGQELDASAVADKSVTYRITQKRAVVSGTKAIYPVVLRLLNYDGTVHSKKTYYLQNGNYPDIAAFKNDKTNVKATATKYSGASTKSETKDADVNGEYKRYYFTGLGSIGRETLIDIKASSPSVQWDHSRLRSDYKADSPEKYIKELDKTNLTYTDFATADVQLSATNETVNFNLGNITYSAENNNWAATINNLPLYNREGKNFYVYKYEITEVTADGETVTNADGAGSSASYIVTYDKSADGKTTTINNKSNEIETEITIKKVDQADKAPLTGATFVLVEVDDHGVPFVGEDGQLDPNHYNSGIKPVDNNGVITFSGLSPGNYLLSEYDTPNGYARIGGGTWYVTVDDQGNATLASSMTGNTGISADQNNANTFIVENEKLENYDPNPPKPSLEHHKRIDALRDKTANPDTDLDTKASADELTDLYRVYLDYTINSLQEPNGVDLLFVIDHSGSMNNTAYGGNANRAPAVMRVLNGPNGNDGIIKDFLDMNNKNSWAAVGFKGDSGVTYFFRPNYRAANAGQNHSENLSSGWSDTPSRISLPNEGYDKLTNYTAGFWRAEQMLFQKSIKDDGKKKVIIFISDGIPTLNIPGLNGTLANAGTATGSKYYPDSSGGCMPQALEQFGYFVNDMTANGYTFGDNAEMYAIGFGDSILASEEGQQLLKNMLAKAYGKKTDENFVGINDPRTGYDPVQKLETALSIIIGKTESFVHVKVEDTLSDYIELYGAAGAAGDLSSSSAKVTMKPNPNTPDEPDSELVLYENGKVTTAGEDIIKGVAFDSKTKTVSTEFKDDYKAQLGYTYTLSFDVRATEKAYTDYADKGNKYTNKGDNDTDYGTNKSSSNQNGFFSNAVGKITYTHNDDSTPTVKEYEHPVIQIFNAPLKILKVDQQMQPVGGAKFNLYSSEYDPDKTIEENEPYLLKHDLESTIKTLEDGSKEAEVTTDKLKHGTYWLVETDAPDNYFDLEGPIKIDVSVVSTEGSDTVNVKASMNGTEITQPYLISAAGEDDWVLKVENKQGIELPSAGGIGTTIFYIFGTILVVGSAVFLIARRRMKISG